MKHYFIPVNKLLEKPYSSILGFPKTTKRQLTSRLAALKQLGIEKVSFQGDSKIGQLDVLGKGYVGIVILGKKRSKLVAIKIRRTDSQRKNLNDEAKLLAIANRTNVGPLLIDSSRDFLVMEYLDGEKIGTWVKKIKGKGSSSKIKTTVRKILDDCYSLDKIGLDHGELSSISKHVIIGKKITLVDFESASTKRRVSNVTSATQGIYIGSGISKVVEKTCKIPPKENMIETLHNYKKEPTIDNFNMVLQLFRL